MDENDVVRVVRLNQSGRPYDGTVGVKRAPEIGNVGTIVHVLTQRRQFFVECVDENGMTVWLSEFSVEELELVA